LEEELKIDKESKVKEEHETPSQMKIYAQKSKILVLDEI